MFSPFFLSMILQTILTENLLLKINASYLENKKMIKKIFCLWKKAQVFPKLKKYIKVGEN